MKNYREFIHIAIFSGTVLIAGMDGDKLKFDNEGHVFLYRDGVIVAHFPNGVWDKATLISKRTVNGMYGTVFQMNYWIEF